jgi:hypothetical protein
MSRHPDTALAEALNDLRATLRAGHDDGARDALYNLAIAVRALNGLRGGSHVRICDRLQLMPLLHACVERFGLGSYEANLALCTCANFAECGGGAVVREAGGLELISSGLESADAEVRYLALAALRNQLAADARSHTSVLGTKTEALLTMLVSADVDARTLDCATSALNNLYAFHGERAKAMGAPPPLPPGCTDLLARHASRRRRVPNDVPDDAEAFLAELLLTPHKTNGSARGGSGAAWPAGGGGGGSLALLGLLGGGLPVPTSAAPPVGAGEAAKTQLLLKANVRRRYFMAVCAADLIRAVALGRQARRAYGPRRDAARAHALDEWATAELQRHARGFLARIAAAERRYARNEVAATARAAACADALARRWLLRLRGAQLRAAAAQASELRTGARAIRAEQELQRFRLRKMGLDKKLSDVELARMLDGVNAAYAAFHMELPLAEQRVERFVLLLDRAAGRGGAEGCADVPGGMR